jgi:two-component system, cell cycle response regulator DivK
MATIMLIEDNIQNARLVEKLLKKAGHQAVVSNTGEEGLMRALEQRPDALMIDLGLPDIDGQTVIAVLRQQESMQGVPLIAFTAWPESSAHSMAKAYGCDGVIIKPINTRTLIQQIEAFLTKPEAPKTELAQT